MKLCRVFRDEMSPAHTHKSDDLEDSDTSEAVDKIRSFLETCMHSHAVEA